MNFTGQNSHCKTKKKINLIVYKKVTRNKTLIGQHHYWKWKINLFWESRKNKNLYIHLEHLNLKRIYYEKMFYSLSVVIKREFISINFWNLDKLFLWNVTFACLNDAFEKKWPLYNKEIDQWFFCIIRSFFTLH